MYKVLDLYNEKYDKNYPVICVDEKSKQLLGDIRKPIPLKQGSVAKYDYEYRRNGTCNIFVAVEPKGGNHYIKVTERRTKEDYANFIKGMIENKFNHAIKVRLVSDNLNTHFEKSFYESFPKSVAKKLLKRIDFIYTPKHASWLNMAEIEINMLEKECLDRNIGTIEKMANEVSAWETQKNMEKKKIHWKFTKEKADKKLSKHYVS
jgi:hypothetical protein